MLPSDSVNFLTVYGYIYFESIDKIMRMCNALKHMYIVKWLNLANKLMRHRV